MGEPVPNDLDLSKEYFAIVVDKNRGGNKKFIPLFEINLDYNIWDEVGIFNQKAKVGVSQLDTRELKRYIYDNKYVEQILNSIGCHHIQYHAGGGYWTACNPDGDNKHAIILYDSEPLICLNKTRQMVKGSRTTDIIDLYVLQKSCISTSFKINFVLKLEYLIIMILMKIFQKVLSFYKW